MRDRPAYPHLMPHCQVANETETWYGTTIREHAAIALSVPDSGDEHIDAMIRQANRRDAAVAAMQGISMNASIDEATALAESAVAFADALIARLEES